MAALEALLAGKVPAYKDERIHVYLVEVSGDPTKGAYGEDGNDPLWRKDGYPARTCSQETAIATTCATAEVVTYAEAYKGDTEFSNQSYEFKTIYRTLEGLTYIYGPKCYGKKRIFLKDFVL